MAAIISEGLWTPPEGMARPTRVAWLAFYSRAMDLYGLTPTQYLFLYKIQKGRCWICRKAKGIHPEDPKAAGTRRLGIDHNHMTGQVRGLLCTGGDKTCNRIIGWLNATQLRRAAEYLDGVRTPGVLMSRGYGEEFVVSMLWDVDDA